MYSVWSADRCLWLRPFRYARPRRPGGEPGTLPDADLALLREHFYGDPFVVQEDLTVGGYVVSDDRAGNFFRSFIIDDGSGAVEIPGPDFTTCMPIVSAAAG